MYLCHKEGAGVNHIQEVSEPTKKRVLREEKKTCHDKNIILNATLNENKT